MKGIKIEEAVATIPDGASLMVGGFMGVGAYTSAVLTIPAQMKGMALPDLYPILQGVELSPYLAMLDRTHFAVSPQMSGCSSKSSNELRIDRNMSVAGWPFPW